jgi:hypothetical protein
MKKTTRYPIPNGAPVNGSKPARIGARNADWTAPSADARRLVPELKDQISIWVNEGGAGGEVKR